MTISFCHCRWVFLSFQHWWEREESLGRWSKKIDSIKAKSHHLALKLWQIRRSIICFKFFSSILFEMKNFKLSQLHTVKLWPEWFLRIKQRFSSSFDPIDEETSPMVDLLVESNVRHENEEKFFCSKKKRFVSPSNEDEIFDNETKFVFRQRASRIDVWWTRQWKLIQWKCDKAPFHWEGKNDELGKRNRRSIFRLMCSLIEQSNSIFSLFVNFVFVLQ